MAISARADEKGIGMTSLVVGNIVHYFDGYIPHPEENAIRLYRNKSDLDYIPPIKIKDDMLSDFGKEILKTESEVRE